ncbi:MAG TPA: NAD(P)/FAD-dependent oxidoreductase [Longimicrobiales bacterium]|nr:NAD(P)/FAD-dependent oxidoreductase [Longimicrobiales bacterium]
MSERASVGVVGAGPAGLAAAWALVTRGVAVTVYERRAEVGGRMRTDDLAGGRVDVAVQLLGSYYRRTFRLAEEVGAGGLLVRSPGQDALWRRGSAHVLTYGSVASMATSSALPTGLKLRLAGRYLGFLSRNAAHLDPNEPALAAEGGLDRESIADWGRRELGQDFVEYLAYPQLSAYYGATPEETSAGMYHGLARAGLDVSVYAVLGGTGELAKAVRRAVEARGGAFRVGAVVEAVHMDPAGATVRTEAGDTSHDAVILAVPAAEGLRLTGLDGEAGAWLREVRTQPTASLALALDRPTPASYFGLSFPRIEPPGDRAVALCVQERKAPGLVPEGKGLVLVFPAPSVAARVAEGTPEQAGELLVPAVERAFPGVSRWITAARLYRFPEGGTIFYPGYLTRLGRFNPAWLPPRLALAGDYLVAPTVEGAVRSGERAARRVLEAVGVA